MNRRTSGVILVTLTAAACLWIGGMYWSARRNRATMASVDAQMAAGKFGAAARDLEQLVASWSASDEAAYVLGICEQSRGRAQAAQQAWARVAPGGAFTQRAVLAGMRLNHDSGKLAAAEKVVINAAADPRNDRTELLVLLVPIFSQIGRDDEAERLLEDRWQHLRDKDLATADESIKLVRLHIELGLTPPSAEAVRVYLDQTGRAAPDDDRVWLGRAHLAIRTGALDEARKWLEACRKRRPDDVPVWRAWLSWGMAAKRVDVVEAALEHLPADGSSTAQAHRLDAWRAGLRGDVVAERRALEQWIEVDPGDLPALDRLILLAENDKQTSRVAELRGKKAEIERMRTRYQQLYDRVQHVRDAEEMARLAERLGRRFEARVFLTLAIADEPGRDDLRRDLERLAATDLSPPGQAVNVHSLP